MKPMPKLSVVIIARNEEHNMRACLDSVSWADEIIVVDDASSDATGEIAGGYPKVKVFRRAMELGFGSQRQFALAQASGEWVFVLDADERVSDELKTEILEVVSVGTCDGFFLRRKNLVLGRFMLDRAARNLRLFRRAAGHFNPARVHESVVLSGRTGVLRVPLAHYSNGTSTVENFLRAANAYSTLSAQDLFERGRRLSWFTLPLYTCVYPACLFARLYIIKGHWVDGNSGFATSFFRALEGFFIYAKLWEIERGRR